MIADFLDCIRAADEGEAIDEDFDRAINAALDAEEHINAALTTIGPLMTQEESDEMRKCLQDDDDILTPSEICHRRTWCIKPTHPPDEPCLELPRREQEPSDFGPGAAKRRRY